MKEKPTTDNERTTILLTDAAPVSITKFEWERIAYADWHDGRVRCQANRGYWICVRQHGDGRAIVYGRAWSNYEHARDLHAGELIRSGEADPQGVIDAIRRVAREIDADDLARDVIASLPPIAI